MQLNLHTVNHLITCSTILSLFQELDKPQEEAFELDLVRIEMSSLSSVSSLLEGEDAGDPQAAGAGKGVRDTNSSMAQLKEK